MAAKWSIIIIIIIIAVRLSFSPIFSDGIAEVALVCVRLYPRRMHASAAAIEGALLPYLLQKTAVLDDI